jgi:LPS O-antigen subunit length determinant protein (WzzB/FepE family)
MTANNYNPNLPQYQEEQEIDIMELVSKLWKKRVMIIKWCVVGAVIGLVVGFSIPKTYSASVTLAPETQQKSSSLSGMASMFGVNLNNSVDAISVEMFPDVVHSTPFIVDLFELPVQFERKDSTINTTLLDYMKNYQKCAWWSYVMNAPFKVLGWCVDLVTPDKEVVETVSEFNPTNLPKDEREVVKFFANNIIVNVDKKTGKTSMSLLMQDPLVVAQVMEAVTDNLKTYMYNYRTSKARQDVANLSSICEERKADYYKAQQAYAKFVDANKNVILQSAQAERERLQQEMNLAYQVYSQVASQLEGSRIEEQQAKPVFTIIHPVIVPISRTAPSKAKMLVIFTFLAGCCAAAWVLFGDEYWQKLKENIK